MTRARLTSVVVALGIAAGGLAYAQTSTESPTRAHVEFLASDALEGREAGSRGERLAADYIIEQLARIGARRLPGRADLLMPFEFTAGSRDAGSSLVLRRGTASGSPDAGPPTGGRMFSESTEVRSLSFSDDAEVTGPVVFAGYGLVVPESQNIGYDSYAALDVTDKIVVVLRYFPEDADQQTRAVLARYAGLRYKAMAARQRGALALVVVTGPRSPNAGELVPMTFDTAIAGSGIPAASISGAVADALFTSAQAGTPSDPTSQRSLRDVQEELDSGNPHVAGFALPDVTLSLTTAAMATRLAATPEPGSSTCPSPPASPFGAETPKAESLSEHCGAPFSPRATPQPALSGGAPIAKTLIVPPCRSARSTPASRSATRARSRAQPFAMAPKSKLRPGS